MDKRTVKIVGGKFSLYVQKLERIQGVKSKGRVGALGARRKPAHSEELYTGLRAAGTSTECQCDGVLSRQIQYFEVCRLSGWRRAVLAIVAQLNTLPDGLKGNVGKEMPVPYLFNYCVSVCASNDIVNGCCYLDAMQCQVFVHFNCTVSAVQARPSTISALVDSFVHTTGCAYRGCIASGQAVMTNKFVKICLAVGDKVPARPRLLRNIQNLVVAQLRELYILVVAWGPYHRRRCRTCQTRPLVRSPY